MGKKLREVESNKYRGGTSDATTPSSLFMMSISDFLPSKPAIFENNAGPTDLRTDGRTDGRTDMTSYRDA